MINETDELPYPAGPDDCKAKSFFDAILSEFSIDHPFENIVIITVNHLVYTLMHFIPSLAKVGRIMGIVPKSSATVETQKTVGYLVNKNFNFLDWTKKGIADNPQQIVEEIVDRCQPQERLIIIDIGGYFAPCVDLFSTDPRMQGRILGIVEDTENGHQKYDRVVNQANFPIISVARSQLKDTEDYNVGKSIVSAADSVLRKDCHQVLEQIPKVGVIGYGKIGSSCATHLRDKGVQQIFVCEKDPIRAQRAASIGFNVVSHNFLLRNSDFIISATGNKGIKEDEFKELKDNVFIASVTSADDEFDLSIFEKVEERVCGNTHTFILKGKKINLLCRGNAINFLYNAVVGPFIYSVQAELIVSAIHLARSERTQQTKLLEMRLSDMERIAKQWSNVFGNSVGESEIETELLKQRQIHFKKVELDRDESIFTAPEPNPFFTGRVSFLSQISNQLRPEPCNPYMRLSISGLGGTGKTELAIQYAWKNRQYYSHVIYIAADTETAIHSELIKIASRLACDTNSKREVWLAEMYQTLSRSGRTLIIFDNIENFSCIESFLPSSKVGYTSSHFAIIITTRCQNMNWQCSELLLDPDHPELQQDACTYIMSKTKCSQNSAKRLASKLQYLPLALSQAVAYIEQNLGCTVENYLQLFDQQNQRMQLLGYPPLEEKKEPVLTTWLISVNSIPPCAKDIIQVCAYIHPDNISTPLLASMLEPNPNSLKSLLQYSLIYKIADNYIKIHRLLQEVIRDSVSKEAGSQENIISTIISLLAQYAIYRRDNLAPCAESVTHFETLVTLINESQLAQINGYHELLLQLALFYLDHEYASQKAVDALLKVKSMTAKENILALFKINRLLAKAYTRLGNLSKAEELYCELERLKEYVSEKVYLKVSLDKYHFFQARKKQDEAKALLDSILEQCNEPSLKAQCFYYLSSWHQGRCHYLEKSIKGKQDDLQKIPSYQTRRLEQKKIEIDANLSELSIQTESAIKRLNSALALNQDNKNTKEIIRTTLQLCRVIMSTESVLFQPTAVSAIIHLYDTVLSNCDYSLYQKEHTQAAICLASIFSQCTPLFAVRGVEEKFHSVLLAEKQRISQEYPPDSSEYIEIHKISKFRQSSIARHVSQSSSSSIRSSASPCVSQSSSSRSHPRAEQTRLGQFNFSAQKRKRSELKQEETHEPKRPFNQ